MSSEPIRILFVDHTPFVGGAQLVLADHLSQIDQKRFEVHIAYAQDLPALMDRYHQSGAILHRIDMPQLKRASPRVLWDVLHAAWRLRRLIQQQRIAIVVSNTSRASYIATVAVLASRVILVWWVRDFLYSRRLFRLLRWRARLIICVSQAIKRRYMPADDRKGIVVYVANGLYQHLSAVTFDQISTERARWGITPGDVVVGFMGRLVAEKGPEDLIRAVVSLHSDWPDLKLLLVGTGAGQMHNVEADLHQLVQQNGWSDFILFAGYQSDEALYYSLFDIFALTTRDHEAFATTVVQAMMAGKPVVATDAGGTAELVINQQTGLLIAPADVAALTKALEYLLKHPTEAKQLAESGHQRAMERHREDVTTAHLEDIYTNLVRSKREVV